MYIAMQGLHILLTLAAAMAIEDAQDAAICTFYTEMRSSMATARQSAFETVSSAIQNLPVGFTGHWAKVMTSVAGFHWVPEDAWFSARVSNEKAVELALALLSLCDASAAGVPCEDPRGEHGAARIQLGGGRGLPAAADGRRAERRAGGRSVPSASVGGVQRKLGEVPDDHIRADVHGAEAPVVEDSQQHPCPGAADAGGEGASDQGRVAAPHRGAFAAQLRGPPSIR